jgi:hypothetical protein
MTNEAIDAIRAQGTAVRPDLRRAVAVLGCEKVSGDDVAVRFVITELCSGRLTEDCGGFRTSNQCSSAALAADA